MEASEVIKKLSDRFEGITTADMEDIKDFLLREKIEGQRAEDFYFCVRNGHESRKMPNIAKMRKYWYEMVGYSDKKKGSNKYDEIIRHNNEVREKWKTFTLGKVVAVLMLIKKKPLSLSSCDTEFWAIYGDLWWEAAALKRKGIEEKDRRHRLEYILQCINEGEEYSSFRDEIRDAPVSELREEKTVQVGKVLIDAATGEVVDEKV